jgi:signal transduction histidine kinase/CheY-like chemotaxis protein/HPt (histidine-containing phosphotransfer) domain-containing protein
VAPTKPTSELPDQPPTTGVEPAAAPGVAELLAELSATREELRIARHESAAAMQARTDFLARMSHEMRTPLAGIIGMANLLRTTPLTGVQQEFADTIRSSGDTLLHLLNDLLDLSKIESGAFELEWRPFSLRDCIDEALDVVSIRAADARLQLGATLDPALPGWALGDSLRLRQILVNLLGNAVKFTPQGQVWITAREAPVAELVAHRSPDEPPLDSLPRSCLLLTVRDSGIGIPARRIEEIFEAYSQVDPSTTRRYGGTGLGLAICRQISRQMGGAIWVESAEGEGSSFHVILPLEAAEQPPDAIYLPHASPSQVLLAVPHPDLRHALLGLLTIFDVTRTRVLDARDLDGLTPDTPGALILDHSPPEQDAVDLALRWEQRRPSSPVFPVILASSREQLGVERRLAGSRIRVVRKPVRWLRLADALGVRWARGALPSPLPLAAVPSGPLAAHIPLRMLVVEDTPMLQRVLVLLLEQLGYEATLAANGQEALDAALGGEFDLIWMDVQMPDIDGLEVTRRLRAARLPRRPWIVAMTASALEQDQRECRDAGMDDFVSKPASRVELIAAVQRADQAQHQAESLASLRSTSVTDTVALEHLGRLFGDDHHFASFLRELAASTERLLEAILDAHTSRQLSEVRLAAHSFKGTAAQVGAHRVVGLAQAIEEAAAGDLRQVGQWIQPLREAQQDLKAHLISRASSPPLRPSSR